MNGCRQMNPGERRRSLTTRWTVRAVVIEQFYKDRIVCNPGIHIREGARDGYDTGMYAWASLYVTRKVEQNAEQVYRCHRPLT